MNPIVQYYAENGEMPAIQVAFIEDTETSRLPEGCERICQPTYVQANWHIV